MAAEEYGPCLPPGLSPRVVEDNPSGISSGSNDALPSYGPCLPPELVGAETNELSGAFGPALPPSGVGTLATGDDDGEGNRIVQILMNKKGEEEDEVELIGPSLPDPDQQVHGSALALDAPRLVMWLWPADMHSSLFFHC